MVVLYRLGDSGSMLGAQVASREEVVDIVCRVLNLFDSVFTVWVRMRRPFRVAFLLGLVTMGSLAVLVASR